MQNTPQNTISKEPLFSVLIANYNNGKYLMDAIDSVRRQTYTHWEIILVDDASTDNSKELYKDLEKDERIHIYYNEENRGCGYTKRRCAELANGEICGFLDPDDALTDDALEVMVNTHKEQSNAAIVSSRFFVCDESLNTLSISRKLLLPSNLSYLENADYSPEHFVSYKKSYYQQTDGIDEFIKMGVDQDLYFRLEEVGEWFAIDKVLYKYRKGVGISFSGYDAGIWNLLVRLDASERRNLPMDWSINMIKKVCEDVCQAQMYKAVLLKEIEVRSSHAYRLGKFLLKPFSFIRKYISR